MARPIKQGLDYFPLDVDIDADDKVAMIEALHGHQGFTVVIKLLAKIYKEGYFYEWSKREQILFSKRVNVDINTLASIIDDCVNEGLFNKKVYEAHAILTSKGIQKRYLEAVKRRKQVIFLDKYFLIDDISGIVGSNKIDVLLEYDDEIRVNVNINYNSTGVNDNISTQRKEKKRKEKNSTTTTDKNDTAKIMQFWDRNGFGFNNINAKNRLLDWLDEPKFKEAGPMIIQAMEIASAANKRTLKYVEGILKNWFNSGCATLADAEAYQLEFNKGGQKTQNGVDWEALANG